MLRYTIKRILIMPLIVLATTFIIFMLLNIDPVDPALQMLPNNYTQEQLDELHEELGLDKPLLEQYANWLVNALHGDFGTSYATRAPVWDSIGYRIPVSIGLALVTMVVVILVSIPCGVMCAVKQYGPFDNIVNVIAKFLAAFPSFWLALMLMLLFCQQLNLLPSYGLDTPAHWILPVVTLALPMIGGYMRQVRSSMLDCIRQDYVRTARSKGASERTVIFSEALRNALLPIITITGTQLAVLVGNAVVVEKCFAIGGIGNKVIEAITTKDIPVVLACTVFLSVFFIVCMLFIDLGYALVDPRIRSKFSSGKKKPAVKKQTVNVIETQDQKNSDDSGSDGGYKDGRS